MFEKLLSFLLHAKGGAVATVLVLGASGALVTATVENGVANITVTQPSQTTTGTDTTTGSTTTSTNTTLTQQILSLFNRTNAEDDPTAPATGNGCSDAAHATNEQVKRVNDAYKTDHAAVLALGKAAPKTDAARTLVKNADSKIKDFRQEGVKKIHELFKSDACKGNDDEDSNEDEDDDNGSTGATGATGATSNTTTTTNTSTVGLSCSDQKACADAAIKAMDDEVTALKTALEGLSTAPATTTQSSEKGKSDKSTKGSSGKGKGHSEGRSHNDDD